ncbi:MAG: CDP-alcohol phosphatidyltransferase family protein [Candidatus Binataceae bacterium]
MASTSPADSAILPKERMLRVFAWGVHLYTALGAALGLLAIHFAATSDFRSSFIVMAIATVIDSSDGPLARKFQVKVRVPTFDGTLLDNIVDYLTYTIAPIFLLLEAGIVRTDFAGLALASFVAVASAYGFCQTNAKTADHYFLGFPSYWNLVAFYLYCLGMSLVADYAILFLFAVMTFIPIKFIYPNRTVPLRPITITFGIVWGVATISLLFGLPAVNPVLLFISLAYIAYYLLASFGLHAYTIISRNRLDSARSGG